MTATITPCVLIHVQLFANSVDWSPPDSPARGAFQARTLEWVSIPYSRASSLPRDRTCLCCTSCTGRRAIYQGSPITPCRPIMPESLRNGFQTSEVLFFIFYFF